MRVSPDELIRKIKEFIVQTNRYPSTRELAEFCGIHPITVMRKIKVLKEQGKIITIPRGGSGISFPPPKPKDEPTQPSSH